MFFESIPAEAPEPPTRPEIPAWLCPSPSEIGAILPVERELARSDHALLYVPTIRAYRTGCTIQIEIALQRGDLNSNDFWDLTMAVHPMPPVGLHAGDPLPHRLMRLGVRFADGTKATTIDPMDLEPTGPIVKAFHASSGENSMHTGVLLWLWPLPPREMFEIAVEWPLGGIPLTFVDFDGAAIVDAAERSIDYWS